MLLLFTVLFGFAYILTPVLAALAWLRFSRSPRRRSRRTRLSVISLATATCSFLLGSVALALSVHSGFLTLDPRWSHLYEVGLILAVLALLIGLVGAKDSNPVRWQAPTVSLGCIFLWFLAGSGS